MSETETVAVLAIGELSVSERNALVSDLGVVMKSEGTVESRATESLRPTELEGSELMVFAGEVVLGRLVSPRL